MNYLRLREGNYATYCGSNRWPKVLTTYMVVGRVNSKVADPDPRLRLKMAPYSARVVSIKGRRATLCSLPVKRAPTATCKLAN